MRPVCAIMITGKPGRTWLAGLAVEAFLAQDYECKQLLVVSDGETPFTTPPPGVHVLQLPATGQSLGQLRSIALDYLAQQRQRNRASSLGRAALAVQWDDDDYSRPDRLSWQVARQPLAGATLCLWELHCHLHSGSAFACCGRKQTVGGFPGTIMHSLPSHLKYVPKRTGEDTLFAQGWQRGCRLAILDNPPALYTRFYHGKNTWHERHVMKRKPGSRSLLPAEREYVAQLRAKYLAARPPDGRMRTL